MPLGPFQTEQVYAPEFEELRANLCLRPQMYVHPVSYGAVCAYLDGFDASRSGGLLMGLHPWLVLRADDGNSLHWSGLALRLLPSEPDDDGQSQEKLTVMALGRLLGEFFAYRQSQGLTKIFSDYAGWLLRQSWYTGPLRQAEASDA
jgi:hypothetical protein